MIACIYIYIYIYVCVCVCVCVCVRVQYNIEMKNNILELIVSHFRGHQIILRLQELLIL